MNTAVLILVGLLTVSAFLNLYLYDAGNRLREEIFYLGSQLARWRSEAILRDPHTGRYIAKGKDL